AAGRCARERAGIEELPPAAERARRFVEKARPTRGGASGIRARGTAHAECARTGAAVGEGGGSKLSFDLLRIFPARFGNLHNILDCAFQMDRSSQEEMRLMLRVALRTSADLA